jgi:hypothetical protein
MSSLPPANGQGSKPEVKLGVTGIVVAAMIIIGGRIVSIISIWPIISTVMMVVVVVMASAIVGAAMTVPPRPGVCCIRERKAPQGQHHRKNDIFEVHKIRGFGVTRPSLRAGGRGESSLDSLKMHNPCPTLRAREHGNLLGNHRPSRLPRRMRTSAAKRSMWESVQSRMSSVPSFTSGVRSMANARDVASSMA